ncbi:hypothetical protein WJX84_004458 [Apatococcus fuscideae]|uniref:V-type proton ATPase subunit H n=1 Tax=Apatococcus fuscideae TaxID=2026836 RepID=A0AAW1SIC9_9CHLO
MSRGHDELTTASVLKRDLHWETYVTARLISERDLQLIRRYDKRGNQVQTSLLEEEGPAYTEAFLTVLRQVSKEEVVQYILALLDDMITVDPARAQFFHEQSEKHLANLPDPYSVFLRLLGRTDWFSQSKACKLLTAVFESRPEKEQAEAHGATANGASSSQPIPAANEEVQSSLSQFIEFLCKQLRQPAHPSRSVPSALHSLACLLREPGVRMLFHRANGLQLLAPLLRQQSASGAHNHQLMYEACLAVWQLTFYQPAAEAMQGAGMVAGLVETARTATKEKVLRMALLAISNLAKNPKVDVAADLVESGLPRIVATRKQQSYDDEDMAAALDFLEGKMKEDIKLLSSFEKYRKEVLSGSLDWSPMHTAEAFWKENVEKFEEKDFQTLRVLLKILEGSRDSRTLAVGCHDLGHFITFHAHGRQIVSDLRGKELVMRLMMHPDQEVQKQALLCVQKIMLARDKLEFMNAH